MKSIGGAWYDERMNRLARERSPYLLQHAANPVDWYPWGRDAFDRASREDKPIFLSIGYSTCHWCHVMEHESFENQEIAELLNRDFVSIKVDREERPDVDRVYMSFVQATTGSGGWPMTVFLTPELKPFFGGTYFPPASRWGRPGFSDLLGELARVWRNDRARVEEAAAELLQRLRSVTGTDGSSRAESELASVDALTGGRAVPAIVRSTPGGIRRRAEVPSSVRAVVPASRTCAPGCRRDRALPPLMMVTETLRAMALGGMRDHIGGGFHRYSVDGEWRVPHFEKMLYDQSQLVLAYLEAAQATGDAFYANRRARIPSRTSPRHDPSSRRVLLRGGCGQYPARAGRGSQRAQIGRGVLHLVGAEIGESSARMRRSLVAGSASSRLGTRLKIRKENSRARTSCISLSRSKRSQFEVARTPTTWLPLRPYSRAADECPIDAAPSVSRRQDPDGMERLDDRGVCPRRTSAVGQSRSAGYLTPPAAPRHSSGRTSGRTTGFFDAIATAKPRSTPTPRTTPI